MKETCPKEEYPEVSEEIKNLASSFLSKEDFDVVEEIFLDLTSGKKKRKTYAILKLKNLIPNSPARPFFYLKNMTLDELPRWTRNSMRYAGDYIDWLLKYWAYEITSEEGCKEYSFGKNLYKIRDFIDPAMFNHLNIFNKYVYAPAKHEWIKPPNRKHRFTPKEVLLCIMIVLQIGGKIRKISKLADQVGRNN